MEEMQCNEKVMWKLMFEIAKLRKENLQLKAEQNLGLSNKILHKEIEVEENNDSSILNEYETEYLNGCESEEDLKAYAEAFNDISIPTVD